MSTPEDEDERHYLRIANVPSCAVDDAAMTPDLIKYLVAFCSYASKRNDNKCWEKQSRIADRLGVSRQAVSNAAIKLESLGYLHSDPAYSTEDGRRLSNTYWIDMNFTIPPERDRSSQPRKRAGIGGKPTHKDAGATPAVVTPATPAVVTPATPAVAPHATPAVAAPNGDRGRRHLIGKGKRVRAHAGEASSPTFNQWLQMPESRIARAWKGGQPPKYRDQVHEYRRYCSDHGLAALS